VIWLTVTSRAARHYPPHEPHSLKEDEMATWDNLPIVIALPLALAAALMSGNAQARQAVSTFITEALAPQPADLGGDPGYLLGTAQEPLWQQPQIQSDPPISFLQ
jgi:hypothetical protein